MTTWDDVLNKAAENNEILEANADLIKEITEVIKKFNALTPIEKSIIYKALQNNNIYVF